MNKKRIVLIVAWFFLVVCAAMMLIGCCGWSHSYDFYHYQMDEAEPHKNVAYKSITKKDLEQKDFN